MRGGRGGSPQAPALPWAGSRVARGTGPGRVRQEGVLGSHGQHRAAAADTQQEVCGAGRERATWLPVEALLPGGWPAHRSSPVL